MAHRRSPAARRPSRLARRVERLLLPLLMTVAALVVERKLRRALGKSAREDSAGPRVEVRS